MMVQSHETPQPDSQAGEPGVLECPAFAAAVAEVERDLAQRLHGCDLPENLRNAVCYSALNGGKRLRPALTLLCCEAAGGTRREALAPAAAIELIHCFSLVHDDLPAMDDDDLRRGRPTLHIHAGEAMAILAGDVMVSLAFDFLSRADLPAERRTALVAELARATTAMIVGQVYDTLGGVPKELAATDEARLYAIHRHKTGALLRAACRLGAMAGGADAAKLDALTRYGEAMGLMFQIVDDVLDVTQSTEHLGKAAGKDREAGKLTFPVVMGLDGSRREISRLREAAEGAITPLGHSAQPLLDLCRIMAVRTK